MPRLLALVPAVRLAYRYRMTVAPSLSSHVTILMGSRNGARWIGAQLDSYLAQTHRDWSLWISDDGSEDGTLDLIDAFANRNPGRVARVLDGPRQGPAANFLHLLCHPDLPPGPVALSDQDDVWLPHKLERALGQLAAAGDRPRAWSARYHVSDAALRPRRQSHLWRRGPSLGNAVVQNILSGHTLTLNAAALALVRGAGKPAVPHHDWWVYLVLMAAGAEAIADPDVVLHYRQHADNVMGVRSTHRGRLSRLAGLRQGRLGIWVAQNMDALRRAPDLPLTDEAAALVRDWTASAGIDRLRVLRRFGVHRQNAAETALVYLAAGLGRL